MKLFFTNSTQHLRSFFKKRACCEIGRYESYAFADGERGYRLKEEVNGESVTIVASILPDPESLFELMALHHLIMENGAHQIAFIIPYLGYARQDRPTQPGEGRAWSPKKPRGVLEEYWLNPQNSILANSLP